MVDVGGDEEEVRLAVRIATGVAGDDELEPLGAWMLMGTEAPERRVHHHRTADYCAGVTNTTLLLALRDPGDPPYHPLPAPVQELLLTLDAPPRLAAHLRVVHDVAHQLVTWTERCCPALRFDPEAVLFGAATHDIGKVIHIAELSRPGSAHEEAGRDLLLAQGISPELARFAGTHAAWTQPGIGVEGLLVSTADKVWKNKRVPELEDLLVARLAAAAGQLAWEVFMALDEALEHIGDGAAHRLAFQSAYPLHG